MTPPNPTSKLKISPCPFCGEDEDLCTDSAHAPDEGFVVACCVCNAMGPNCESSLGAVRAWNERRIDISGLPT